MTSLNRTLFMAISTLFLGLGLLMWMPGFDSARAIPARISSAKPSLNLAFLVPGRLTSLPIEVGTEVSKGMLIAELDSSSLWAQQQQVDSELSALYARRDRLALQMHPNPAPDAVVAPQEQDAYRLWHSHLSSLLSEYAAAQRSLEAERSAAEADLLKLESQSALLTARGARSNALAERGLLAQSPLEDLALEELQLEASLTQRQMRLDQLRAQSTYQAANHERALSSLQLQSLTDHEATLRQIASFEAQKLRLMQEIDQHRLYAPAQGTVLSIEAALGQTLAAGSALARFESEDGLAVEAFIAPDLRAEIFVGAPAQVQGASHNALQYPSHFTAISPDAQSMDTGQYFVATLELPAQINAPRGTPLTVKLPASTPSALAGLLAPALAANTAP